METRSSRIFFLRNTTAPRLLRTGLFLLGLVCSSFSLAVTEIPADPPLSCSPGTTLELIRSRGQDDTWELLARSLEASPGCAALQRDWALISLRTGRLAEARRRLLAAAQTHPDTPAIHFGLGLNLLYDQTEPGAMGQSRTHLERARTLLAGEKSGEDATENTICEGFCLLALSALAPTPDEQVRMIGESLASFEAGGSVSGRGLAQKQLAGLRQRQGDTREALRCAGEALASFAEQDTLGGAVLALHLAGNAHYRLGEAAAADQQYHRSMELAEEQADDESRLRNMVALALLSRTTDVEAALRWFDQSIPVARQLGLDDMLLYVLTTRGTICGTELNRYRTALDSFSEALEVARRAGRWSTVASCLANMGHIRSFLGDYDAALLELQEAAELIDTRKVADGPLESFINREMGYLLWKNGAEEEALARLDRAATVSDAAGDTVGLANARHLQGAVLSAAGRLPEARAKLESAFTAYQRQADEYGQACVSYSMGRTAEALGDPDRAGELYLAATRLSESGGYPILAWSSNYRLGRLALAGGDLVRARQRLELALEAIHKGRAHQAEDTFRWSYMEDKHQVFCSYVDVLDQMARGGLLEQGAGLCFTVAEQAHASSLLDLLRAEEEGRGGDAEALPRITTDQALAALPGPDSWLLEYLLGEDVSFLFLLARTGLTIHRLPPRVEIESLAAGYLEQLRNPPESLDQAISPELAAAGRSLFSILLGPAADQLATGNARLVIVADGLLHHLPFEALALPGNGPPTWLAQRHEISYAHSAAVLAELRDRGDSMMDGERLELLAIGNPDFGGEHPLPPLPHSGREVRRIARRLARARAFTGKEARKSLLADPELAGARVIHLATHALVDEVSARDSAIVFSKEGPDGQDGLLSLEEIGALELDADLVVLSACSTGLGRPVHGEGVVGLSRAFISAGSRCVVHTLWPVEDRFTARLMESFFDGLVRGESKAAALTGARRALLEDGAHPHFWAPFVLVGESSSALYLEPRPRRPWLLALVLIVFGLLTLAGGIHMLKRRQGRT